MVELTGEKLINLIETLLNRVSSEGGTLYFNLRGVTGVSIKVAPDNTTRLGLDFIEVANPNTGYLEIISISAISRMEYFTA